MHSTPVAATEAGADGFALEVRYLRASPAALPADAHTLAVVGFGDGDGDLPDQVRVPLQPIGDAALELWRVPGPVERGTAGAVRFARGGGLQLFAIAVDEAGGDIRSAARHAYATARAFLEGSDHPHALRVWNTIAAITAGHGDGERYRQFCIGRAEGMGSDWGPFPAATAVGSQRPRGRLQVYGLSASAPGVPVENPRQVSAWRYPREYGPQPPSFARAMLGPGPGMPLLVSGTASVVGHASAHAGSVLSQLDETCANLERLLASAREQRPALPERFGAASTLKVYLHQPEHAAAVRERLEQRFPGAALLLLHAQVCRRELLVEIDGFHGP
jgi:chorismate lyase/3-hydroxybenzoate synthase